MGIFDWLLGNKYKKDIRTEDGLNKVYNWDNGFKNYQYLQYKFFKKNGIFEGDYTNYFKCGETRIKGQFKNNLMHGEWSLWAWNNERKEPGCIEIWENGKLKSGEFTYDYFESRFRKKGKYKPGAVSIILTNLYVPKDKNDLPGKEHFNFQILPAVNESRIFINNKIELEKHHNQKNVKQESLLKKSKELSEKKRLEDKIKEDESHRKKAEALMYKKRAEELAEKKRLEDKIKEDESHRKKSEDLMYKKRAEELAEKKRKEAIKEMSFKNSTKFTKELKKYIKTHNESAVIEVFPSNGGVWEEYIYRGTWNSKKFKMKASIPLKNADYQYDGSLSEFINEIGNKKITELDNSNLNLELLGDSGGSWEVEDIVWNPKLTKEEEKEIDVYNLVDFEMDYDEDDFIFEKGCIYEIKVTIEDKVFTLVK